MYKVDVTRIGYSHVVLDIEAENMTQATQYATDAAANRVLSEKSSEYEIESIELVSDKIIVGYEVGHNGKDNDCLYRVRCGLNELRYISEISSRAALEVYAQSSGIKLEDCNIEDLTGESDDG
jgi:DNA-dependent RNA polymerase auxiliary subunit epsilon